MNQILFINKSSNKLKKNILYKIIFIFCIFFICCFIFFCVKTYYSYNSNFISSENLNEAIRIQSLYNNKISYNNYPVIGRITIPSINISYPIFSETTDDYLKLGICKVYGPSINNKRESMFSRT